MNNVLSATAPGHPGVPVIAMKPMRPAASTPAEFLAKQSTDQLCGELASAVGKPRSEYNYSCNWFLNLVSHTDGAVQRLVPRSLRERILQTYISICDWPCTTQKAPCMITCEMKYSGHLESATYAHSWRLVENSHATERVRREGST